jgi:DNA-binding response OmpR family regulator
MNTQIDDSRVKAVFAPAQKPVSPAQRILVVEDDAVIRELNAEVLICHGYQVADAEDGAAGWEALHADRFDLMITDHEMPRLSGVELVKKARSARMTLPIILATGRVPEQELERHPWLQLAATLRKPFSPDQLVKTVKRVLGAPEAARVGRTNPFPLLVVDALRQSSASRDPNTHR